MKEDQMCNQNLRDLEKYEEKKRNRSKRCFKKYM